MNSQDKILKKFQKLLDEGGDTFSKCGWDGRQWTRHPSGIDYLRFRTESLNLIKRVCGKTSNHYQEMKNIANSKEMTNKPYYYHMCYGILEAAHNDFVDGFLFDMRSLISAELLGDFMEQAETLLKKGYYVPAASLTGAVLENSLRRLCEKHDIEIPEKTTIDKLNSVLAKAEIYNKHTQKSITAQADVRNNADHGHYDKFLKEDVEFMVKWVTRFEEKYLG